MFFKNKSLKPEQTNQRFKSIVGVWKNALLLRWFMTDWCNYSCPYCIQEHSRNRKYEDFMVHAFDNKTPEEWVNAITKIFASNRLALTITGGEPMLDQKNMISFLSLMLQKNFVDNIRVDTNLSWNPQTIKDLHNKQKLIFMCTYHPTQTKLKDFLYHADLLQNQEFKVGIVNYVMTKNQEKDFAQLKQTFLDNGLILHPNPLWNTIPNERIVEIMKQTLPDVDLYYRTGNSPKGKYCYYPVVAYEMNQNGTIHSGCDQKNNGNIFENKLPKLPDGPIKCKHSACSCLDKYSFIEGVNRNTNLNILETYSEALKT